MDETILRVIQAIQIQESFNYVLNNAQIEYLRNEGYKVEIISTLEDIPWLYECVIQK